MIFTGFICVFGSNGEPVERIGSPTFYSPDVERYRFQMDVSNPLFYPIPNDEVTRDTYVKWLEDSGLLKYAEKPEQGLEGPIKLMPVLAKYVKTGEDKWGQACIAMLKDFHGGIQEEVKSKGWTERFIEESAFIPIYRKYLIIRYLWEGPTAPGQQLLFTQVYYPHRPFRFRANTNNPGAKAVYIGGDFAATVCASGIEVIQDTIETTVMRFAFDPDRVEWVIFNQRAILSLPGL